MRSIPAAPQATPNPTGTRRRRLLPALAISAITIGLLPAAALAQDFPVKGKPIRIIVSFPPGAGPDAMARIMLPKLGEVLGTPVVIENRPGGGTLISANEVMKSAPDGHTVFFSASSTMVQAPHTLKAATYDPTTAFTPITMGARGPLVLLVNSALGLNSVQDVIAYGKANPGKLSYGSFGVGSSAHIFGQVFSKNIGVPMEHVPYKGGAEIVADLTEGRLPLAFDAAPQGIQTAKTGKAKIIGVASAQRHPSLPGIPTISEQGVKDVDLMGFVAWFGPAGMKPEVAAKLRDAISQALAQPNVQTYYRDAAYIAEPSTPAELAAEVAKGYESWGRLVKAAGIEKQ
jgi:tripartite-type tricarboxylate transporter receptor subunit TctC